MKNTEAKNGKLRFNVIDVLIIVLVIACIVAMVLRFTVLDDFEKNQEEKEYIITFKVDSLTYDQLESILLSKDEADNGGDWIYLNDGETKLGKIVDVDKNVWETLYFVNENGEKVSAEYPFTENEEDEKNYTWTIEGTISCSGVYNDNSGFLLNGDKYLASNSKLDVRTKYCDFTLTVISIDEAIER